VEFTNTASYFVLDICLVLGYYASYSGKVHWRFGTTYNSRLRTLDPWRWYWLVIPKRPYDIAATGCVIPQKGEGLIYLAAEVWNRAKSYSVVDSVRYI